MELNFNHKKCLVIAQRFVTNKLLDIGFYQVSNIFSWQFSIRFYDISQAREGILLSLCVESFDQTIGITYYNISLACCKLYILITCRFFDTNWLTSYGYLFYSFLSDIITINRNASTSCKLNFFACWIIVDKRD